MGSEVQVDAPTTFKAQEMSWNGMARLQKPEDQEVFCKIVSLRNSRDMTATTSQQYGCLNKS